MNREREFNQMAVSQNQANYEVYERNHENDRSKNSQKIERN